MLQWTPTFTINETKYGSKPPCPGNHRRGDGRIHRGGHQRPLETALAGAALIPLWGSIPQVRSDHEASDEGCRCMSSISCHFVIKPACWLPSKTATTAAVEKEQEVMFTQCTYAANRLARESGEPDITT